MNNFLKIYTPHMLLGIVIFFCMGSALWSPGGVLLLDYVLTPHAPINWYGPVPFIILDGLSHIIDPEIVSKAFFLGTLLTSAYLGILFGRLIAKKYDFSHVGILEFFGGLFLILNPFAYERMMVQPVIYLGIISLGYLMYVLFAQQGYKKWILAGMFAGAALNLFLHAAFMIALIVGWYIVFFVRKRLDIIGVLIAIVIAFVLNANWLLAPIFGVHNSTSSIGWFDAANYQAFITQSLEPLNVWGTNLLLYGFWGERYSNHYASVEFLSTLWYIAGLACLGLMAFALKKILYIKTQRKYLFFLVLLAFFSLIFGIGIASPITEGLTLWMAEYIPFWQGYREPQKWIGILMMVEMILFLVGMGYILTQYGKDRVVRISTVIAVLWLLITWSPGPLWGYHGQLRTSQYPEEYAILRWDLMEQGYTGTTLALPWHSYIGCSWMGRPTVSNPIKGLMSPVSIVSADNIEVSWILYTNSQDTTSQKIEGFLKDHDIALLYDENIDAILLMKQCANSESYQWLDTLKNCTRTVDNAQLSWYRCHL